MARPPRLPPIHALSAFESAARLGGFAQAAGELCITPSAVSHRIRLLEAQLGEQLFERSHTGVRLSAAGRRYLAGVREAFDRLAHLSCGGETRPVRLRVGSPPTFARNLLMPRLPEFYRQWPEIEIEVAVAAPMQDKPERHDVDIRFGRAPFDERQTTRLFDDRVQVLAAPASAARLALHEPADLARAELLRSPLVPWKPWFEAAGLDWPEPARGLVFTDLGILLEAAASGLGLAICPLRIAGNWTSTAQLLPLFGISVAAASTYHVLVERELAERPEVAAFVEWLGVTFA
ncbi:LysR substrate-binding domain-containing protein [Rubrivivax sp. A210]|uniref:LysR substrate-binding domain-containing protein n=1 Tax=Rubrivivax sp. A210 TaxID=2772301 RepID=UPI0019196242|nr:LysR substrate-binding domain-containing protein [Rubrivivax sp. A210]